MKRSLYLFAIIWLSLSFLGFQSTAQCKIPVDPTISFTGYLGFCELSAGPTLSCNMSQMEAGALYIYQWYRNEQPIYAATPYIYTINVTESGNYRAEVINKDSNGNILCARSTQTVTATKFALPNATLTSDKSYFCEGSGVALYSTADMDAYEWYKKNYAYEYQYGYVGFTQTPNFTAAQEGIYRVRVGKKNYFNQNNSQIPITCYKNSGDLEISKKPLPGGLAISTGSTGVYINQTQHFLCPGDSVELHGYSSNSGNNATVEWIKDGSFVINPLTNQNYIGSKYTTKSNGNFAIKVTDVFGCASTSGALKFIQTIPKSAKPAIQSSDNPPVFPRNVLGNCFNLQTSNYSFGYVWSKDGIAKQTVPNGGYIYVPGNNPTLYTGDVFSACDEPPSYSGIGKYTVKTFDQYGCSNISDDFIIKPNAAFSGLSASYCTTSSNVTLTPKLIGGIFTGPGISGNIFNPSLAGAGTHTITYSITVNGIENNSAQTVIVKQSPTVTTSDKTICTGQAVNLTLSADLSGSNYSWSVLSKSPTVSGTTVGYTGIANPIPTVLTNSSTSVGTVDYKITLEANGCSGSKTVTVKVAPRPTSVITGTTTICNGSSTPITINLTGIAPWSLTYSDGTTSTSVSNINSSPFAVDVSPASTKTYTVTVLNDANCTSLSGDRTGSAVITVINRPSIILGANPQVCAGAASASLSYSSAIGSPDKYRIDWDANAESKGFVDKSLTTLTTSPISISGLPGSAPAGIYNGILYVKNNTTGCESVGYPFSVSIGVTITLGANPIVCAGTSTATVNYTATTGSPNQYSIDWNAGLPDVGLTSLPLGSIPISGIPAAAGTYNGVLTVRKQGAGGCSGALSIAYPISVTVTVANQLATITPPSSTTFCSGEPVSVLLNANTNPENNLTYQWLKDGLVVSTETPYTATAVGSYKVIVTNNSTGCSATSSAVNVTTQTAGLILKGGDLCLDGFVTLSTKWGGTNFMWSTSETTSQIEVTTAGTYSVNYTSTIGCALSASTSVILNPHCFETARVARQTETNDNYEELGPFGVYPNPVDNELVVHLNAAAEKNVDVELFNLAGISVKNGIIEKGEIQVSMATQPLPDGIYIVFLKAGNNETRSHLKVMIAHKH